MTLLQRIAREPNAVAGVIAALYGLAVAFDLIELTVTQVGSCVALWGAVIFAIRWFVTPAAEVVVQKKPEDPTPIAGAASYVDTGSPVEVDVTEIPKAA